MSAGNTVCEGLGSDTGGENKNVQDHLLSLINPPILWVAGNDHETESVHSKKYLGLIFKVYVF